MSVVVAIHGAGGGGWEYDLWRPVFEDAGYILIVNDLQPSPGGLASTQAEDYLNQIRSWIPQHERAILVGASMGGLLALKVAEELLPAALVLINSLPPSEVTGHRPDKPYPPIIEWANGPLAETQAALFDSEEAIIQWAWPRWRNESGAVLQQLHGQFPVQRPACPTLAVLGKQDQDIPYRTGLALAQWAGADLHLYSGMSHVGPLLSRRAVEVAQATLAWCQARLS